MSKNKSLLDGLLDFSSGGDYISGKNSLHIDVLFTFLHELLPHLLY